MTERFKRLRPQLACPQCRSALETLESGLRCGTCERDFPITDGIPRLRLSRGDSAELNYSRSLRSRLRLHPGLYRWLFRLFAPVLVTGPDAARRLAPLTEPMDALVLDLGAGNDRRDPRFIGIDTLPYPEIDLVAEAATLPLADGSVAGVLSIALLEHVPDSDALLDEIHRVLREGGRLFLVVPFLQPLHAAPSDFRRFTVRGLHEAVTRDGRFRVLDEGVYCGPASALCWLLAEWCALVFSAGIPPLRRALSPLLQVVFSPLKWLDFLLARLPGAETLASAVFVEAEKTPSGSD